MGNYQQYDIKSIGWMTSIPYLLQTVTVLCATWLSDYLRVSNRLNLIQTRLDYFSKDLNFEKF